MKTSVMLAHKIIFHKKSWTHIGVGSLTCITSYFLVAMIIARKNEKAEK